MRGKLAVAAVALLAACLAAGQDDPWSSALHAYLDHSPEARGRVARMKDRTHDAGLRTALTWLLEREWPIEPSSRTTKQPVVVKVGCSRETIEHALQAQRERTCNAMVAIVTVTTEGRAQVQSVHGIGQCQGAEDLYLRCVKRGFYFPKMEDGAWKEAPFAVVIHLVLD